MNLLERIEQTLLCIQNKDFLQFNSWMETADILLIENLMGRGILNGNEVKNDFFTFTQKGIHSKSGSSLMNICSRNDVEKSTYELVRVLSKTLNDAKILNEIQKDIKDCFRYVISEILNNIADHSNGNGIAIAQYYKTKKKVQFSALDNGIGFLANIKRKFSNINTQEEAIKKALEKGITTSSYNVLYASERNIGYGLFVISQLIQVLKESELVILSQDTHVSVRNKDGISVRRLKHNFECTLVCFEIDENSMRKLDYDIDTMIQKIVLPNTNSIDDVF